METQMQRMDLWAQQGKERVGQIGRVAWKYTLACGKQIANGRLLHSTGSSAQDSVMTQRGGREAQEWGDTCILMTDSRNCMAETNTNQHNINYPPIKKRKVSPVKFRFQKFNSLFQRASWISDPGHVQNSREGIQWRMPVRTAGIQGMLWKQWSSRHHQEPRTQPRLGVKAL